MPKPRCYRKREPRSLKQVEIGNACKRIWEAMPTTEIHIALSCIAIERLQCLSISFLWKVKSSPLYFPKKSLRKHLSKGVFIYYLCKHSRPYGSNTPFMFNTNNSIIARSVSWFLSDINFSL